MYNISPDMMAQAESIAKMPGVGMLASALQNPIVAGFASTIAGAFGISVSPQQIMAGAKVASAYIDHVKSQGPGANNTNAFKATGDPISQFIQIIASPDVQKLFSFLQNPAVAAVASSMMASVGIQVSPLQITTIAPQIASFARTPGAGFMASALQNPIIASVASLLSPLTGVPMSPQTIMMAAKGGSMVIEQVKREDMQNAAGPRMGR